MARGGSEAFALAAHAAGCVAGDRGVPAHIMLKLLRRSLGDYPADPTRSRFLAPRLQRPHDMLALESVMPERLH